MKWPEYLMLIRHDVSAYNVLKKQKMKNPAYRKFLRSFEDAPGSEETRRLAEEVCNTTLSHGDHDTPLADIEARRAEKTAKQLQKKFELPDVVFVSPYERALATFEGLKRGWPELARVKVYEDERLREQGHGLALLYNDWRIFHAIHPLQRQLFLKEGRYWYRYPQGENVPDVRDRNRSWTATIIRDFAEKKVMAITHHLNILAMRANFERLGAEEFIRLDEKEKPINCGVTLYAGNPALGKDGRLELEFYNRKYY